MEIIDLDSQVNLGHYDLEFWEIWLFCMLTCNWFELESKNLHNICILVFSAGIETGVIDLNLDINGGFSSSLGK